MTRYAIELLRWFEHMNTQQWAVVLLVVAVVGCLCMRGLGTRAN